MERRANTKAKHNAPTAVANQPKILMDPIAPKFAGKKKIPVPIILPTTKDVAVQKPNIRWFEIFVFTFMTSTSYLM